MGVMSCSRNGCDNILCDTYINNAGYICYECQGEFRNYLQMKGSDTILESIMLSELKLFMTTEKESYSSNELITTEQFFKKHT